MYNIYIIYKMNIMININLLNLVICFLLILPQSGTLLSSCFSRENVAKIVKMKFEI